LRALAERGLARFPSGREELSNAPRIAGVHVAVHPSGDPMRPATGSDERPSADERSRDTGLVTKQSLGNTPDGGSYAVARGAIITDLAREEAWRRRIVLHGPSAHAASTRGDGRLRVALAADHGGFLLKQAAIEWVREFGHVAFDLGTHDEKPVDYPDFARAVAEAVSGGRADFGISVDSAGIGSAIAANKVPGARAAHCHDVASAKNAREHNHANVLTLGGKTTSAKEAREIVRVFLATLESGDRHANRVQKINRIEVSYLRPSAQPGGEAAR
jgi:ribose 5-phosphate isomerase B